MKPFLQKLAETLFNKYGNDISGIQLIFPSRRAGLYFKNYLSGMIESPVWAPVTCGISDFISENSDFRTDDDLILIFVLYSVYKKFSPDLTFDKFYPWGAMILRDFDEIDKNLVKADHLFRILKEHKKIEEDFEFNVADIDEFYRFWDTFSARKLTSLQDEFIKTWEVLGKVYNEFRNQLISKNICYEGMAYRNVFENVRAGKFTKRYDKYIFAGFNQLNKCEEGIIQALLKNDLAETYWDTDKFYLEEKNREAGKFLRENFANLNINSPQWKDDNFSKNELKIKFIGAPLEVSQAKVLGNEIAGLLNNNYVKTAIILPDDKLLISVLHSIPDITEKVNITMGFSFKNSLLYSFTESLRSLQLNCRGEGSKAVYYHKDIITVLMHPYIRSVNLQAINKAVNSVKSGNIVYASQKSILTLFAEPPEIISLIFSKNDSAESSLKYLNNIFSKLFEVINSDKKTSYFENEILSKAFSLLNRTGDIVSKHAAEIINETFWNVITESFSRIKVPFSGDPLEGIQIMGMLETRSLDFDNVIILSVNEGILPPETGSSSFIPYALKKAFRMPVGEDTEADYAYYFYRLLQRAKNVTLIYNTETGVISAGEKSRFIMQVQSELAEYNRNIKTEEYLLSGDIDLPERKEISIVKTTEVLNILKNEKQFSATALSTYINCPLQFYFKKAAKLKEEEEVEEYFSAAAFGNIFHQIMQNIYSDDEGNEITQGIIDRKITYIKENFDEVWKKACHQLKEYSEFAEIKLGKNLLYKRVIEKLVNKVLLCDKQQAPFKIVALESDAEKEFTVNVNNEKIKVKLFGRLDRVELKDNIIRIIDYKSGNAELKNQSGKTTDEDSINQLFENIKRKENFQQLFYASLYLNSNKKDRLIFGIYALKNLAKGVFWFEEEPVTPEKISLFEKKLVNMFEEIFDKDIPFSQTRDTDRCKHCPYISICYRD